MAVMKFLVYVTCFFLSQDLVFCDDYGESGNKITLTPSIRGNPEEILWTHNGNKVLEYDGSEVATYGSFRDRVDVDFETGQLTIRKLNSQDSGRYQSEIWINRKAQISSHTLTVLDALPEPQVICELNETSNLKKLSCSVESQTQPSYEWSGPDIKHSGPTLLVKEQEENRNSVYTCTVKNKAGSRTTDFTLQDCHTVLFAGGVSLAVLVPVLIVILLLIILLAVLALYIYRRKKQKLGKSGLKTMDVENGEYNSLLRNVPMEAMPGSSEATLPCRTRLTPLKESIADKKWDQDSELENAGETHEGQKLLKESLQSAITEENKDNTGNTNEGELYKNEKNRENADEGENTNSKADETDTEVESQNSLQAQEEMEKSQIRKNESEDEEESPEEQTETLEQETKDADTNEEDQKLEEKEEENKEIDSLNTGEYNSLLRNVPMEAMPGSSEATLPCRTRLTPLKESIADKKWDQDSELENAGETHEGQKLLKESLQSAITEENKDDTGNTNEGELYKSEKSQIWKNESEDEEESPEDQTETLEQETKDADTNEEDQKPKEKEEENKEIDSLNTAEEELEKNQYNSENADEAEENTNSKPDETDTEIESQNSLQAQEEMEKSQILKNESEDEEQTPEEQTETLEQETKDADTNEEDQKLEEKKEEEEENKEIDSLSTVDTGNVAEQLHKNDKSSQNENGDQSIEQQNKSLCISVKENNQRSEGEKEEEEKTEKKNHEGTGRLHTAEPCNPPLLNEAPSDPMDSPSNLDISVPSSNLNMELENKQAAFFPQEEDDDDEQTDKSSESEHGMKEKKDGPEIKETKNKL